MTGNNLQNQNVGNPPTDQMLVQGNPMSRISDSWRRWFIAIENKINIITASLANLVTGGTSAGILTTNGSGTITSLDGSQGSILYRGSSGWSVLGPGTSGQVLETQGANANPTWSSSSGGGGSPINVSTQTGVSYTFALTDAPAASSYRGWVNMNNPSTNDAMIAPDSSVNFPTGTEVWVTNYGVGQTTIQAGTGVTIFGPSITGTGQYSLGRITKIAANTWWCDGAIPFTSVNDPYWSSVQFLLHGNGVNGGTTITDQKGGSWAAQGSCVTSTAQYKFNGSSIAFNGTNTTYINTPYNSNYDRTNKDFTLEFWVYLNNVGASGQEMVQVNTDTGHAGYSEISVSTASGVLYFLLETSAGSWTYSSGGTLTANTWIFIAVQVASGNATAYINGTNTFTFTTAASVTNSGQSLIGNSQVNQPLNGYLAEIRYTLGVARYSSNFSNPTAPFPNS